MSEIADFFHSLIAWRKFDTTGNNKLLTSAGHTDHVWPVADLGEAYCRSAAWSYPQSTDTTLHDAPQLDCTCGFYCYKDRKDAEQHAQGKILAKVEVWGRLAEHTRGYRAQHMKILALYVAPGFSQIDALAKRYGVAVFIDEGADTWISENPYGSSSLNPSSSPNTFITPQWVTNPYPSQALLQNGSNNPLASLLNNGIGGTAGLSGHALSLLTQQQQNIAQSQYHAALNALNAYTPPAPIISPPLIGSSIVVRLPQKYTTPRIDVLYGVKSLAPSTLLTISDWHEEVDEPEVSNAANAVASDMDNALSSFDPVADRVNRRLRSSCQEMLCATKSV